MLADQGLRAALQAQADRAPMPVLVDADGIGRYSRDAETTLYFCILEALQNAAKYAQATLTTVTLNQADGEPRSSASPTTAQASTPRPPRTAPACKAWPTGSQPSAASCR